MLRGDNPAVVTTQPRWTIRAAGVLALVSVVATLASLLLYLDNRRHVDVSYTYADVVAGVLYPCLGAFLVRRRPDNRVGWILVATWVVGLNGLANQYAVQRRPRASRAAAGRAGGLDRGLGVGARARRPRVPACAVP